MSGYLHMEAQVKPDTAHIELIRSINELTYDIANEHDQFYSFKGVRALAMVHLACHDILVSQGAPFAPYAYQSDTPDIESGSALVESTRRILKEAYPDRISTIDSVCDRWLDHEDNEARELGEEVADFYIDLRDNDGHEKNGDYTPMTKPGDYQYTPGFDWVWKPDFSVARPFTLESLTQFRSPPPPDMSSPAYTESYEEVRMYGCKDSPVRTKDQTHIAHWWAEFGEHSWNRIGRLLSDDQQLSATELNRMFALINMSLYDLYLVSFDSKYFYDTWRPYTAIREGADDGNPDTGKDPDWEPEMTTPPWPEYPSAHAAVGALGAEIVSNVFGTPEVKFEMTSVTASPPGTVRKYDNLDHAANDCADSRIMNGFHFRFATEEGKRQGRKVAQYVLEQFLRPLPGADSLVMW